MTTSEAIEVLKVIRQPENLKKMVYFNYEDGNQALDKAIEVMGSSCDNCTNQHRDFTPSYNFIDEESNEL